MAWATQIPVGAAMRDELPPVLNAIAEAVGTGTMLLIAERYGGRRVDLPARPTGRNWLSDLVGPDEARAIVDRLGSGRIDIPFGPAGTYAKFRRQLNKRYGELKASNATAAEISRELGITERAVRYRRKKSRRDREQADFFEP